MRIARWRMGDTVVDGIVRGNHCLPWPDALSNEQVIAGGLAAALETADRIDASPAVPLADVTLLVPLRPTSMRDFVAFEEHVEGVVRSVDASEGVTPEWYEYPTFYFTNPHTLVASGETVIPPKSERLDFELELAIVVGGGAVDPLRGGSNLTPAEGQAAIFGYTILNDWSARDVQAREMKVRLGPAKGKDFASTLGPWIVTADEFTDRHDAEGFLPLEMVVEVNGTEVGRDSLANISWPLGELVAYASRNSRVMANDVLGSGTAGAGCLAELWGRGVDIPALREGDEVIMRVEGIGEIRNTVGPAPDVPHIPSARTRPRIARSYSP
ncbi:MAG: fumarylacetoacetate hydrolase family protein [Microbacteriaceae bacterium]